jgi:hypothetical protein
MTARRSDETSVVLMHLVDAFDLHIAEFEIVNNGEVLLAGHNSTISYFSASTSKCSKTRRTLAFPSAASIVIGLRTTSYWPN